MGTSMIDFERRAHESTFLDPGKGFEPVSVGFETRLDPLTGRSGHFSHFGAIAVPRLPLESYETAEVKGFCPFCPEHREKYTPRFPDEVLGEGRPTRNEAFLIPNLFPYDIYNGVVVMGDRHVVPLEGFTAGMLEDSFSLGIVFLRTVAAKDPALPYHATTWNYMPPSGGGLVHPHQQCFASAHPGNQYTDELRASERFMKDRGVSFWHEFVKEEERIGSRYIGKEGGSHWISSFVSHGLLGDILCIFPEVYSVHDFGDSHLCDLVGGLQRIFRYFGARGIGSFNSSLFFGPSGQKSFSAHFRIVPRTFLNLRDYASDLNFFQAILGEPVSVVLPEVVCNEAKAFFA